jgi:hypothetical protein
METDTILTIKFDNKSVKSSNDTGFTLLVESNVLIPLVNISRSHSKRKDPKQPPRVHNGPKSTQVVPDATLILHNIFLSPKYAHAASFQWRFFLLYLWFQPAPKASSTETKNL